MNAMKKTSVIFALLLIFAIAIGALHLLHAINPVAIAEDTFTVWTNVVTVICGLLPVAAGLLALSFFGLRGPQGKSVLLLTIAMALWAVADWVWMLSAEAVVSLADVFYLVGYPLVFAATVIGLLSVKPDFFKETKRVVAMAGVSLAAIAFYLFYFPLSWDAETSAIENVVTSGYVIADILLLIPVIFFVGLIFSGFLSKPWLILGLGILFWVVADIYYARFSEVYASGDLIDLAWYYGSLCFTAALVLLRYKTEEILKT